MPPRTGSAVRLARWGLLALLPLLGGCAAAVLAPAVLAGGTIATVNAGEARPAEPAPAPAGTQEQVPAPIAIPPPPPPSLAAAPSATDAWQPLVDYALTRRRELGGLDPAESALLVNPPTLEKPDRLPCVSSSPGVLIDLDPGTATFAPDDAVEPAAGLAEALARLRAAGVVVLWISQADANRVNEIGAALRRTGLDPAGRDPLLLVRTADQRKQVMREEANKSVCLLAIAGDRRGDFDELFDYLRVPERAAPLDAMLGDGWFLTPLPLAAAE